MLLFPGMLLTRTILSVLIGQTRPVREFMLGQTWPVQEVKGFLGFVGILGNGFLGKVRARTPGWTRVRLPLAILGNLGYPIKAFKP